MFDGCGLGMRLPFILHVPHKRNAPGPQVAKVNRVHGPGDEVLCMIEQCVMVTPARP